jgi:translation initiation factor eIF-2B subunit delta
MACANLVLLGTHALHANGALYARAGTAMVAMMAKERSVPVLACCETYKFTNSVPFDGFTKNELGRGGISVQRAPICRSR